MTDRKSAKLVKICPHSAGRTGSQKWPKNPVKTLLTDKVAEWWLNTGQILSLELPCFSHYSLFSKLNLFAASTCISRAYMLAKGSSPNISSTPIPFTTATPYCTKTKPLNKTSDGASIQNRIQELWRVNNTTCI